MLILTNKITMLAIGVKVGAKSNITRKTDSRMNVIEVR